MANQVEKLNGIAIGSIEKFNGATDSNIEKINGLEFTGSVPGSKISITNQEFASGRVWGSDVTWDPDTDTLVALYGDDGNGDYPTYRLGKLNATTGNVTITWQNSVALSSAGAGYHNKPVYDTGNNRMGLVFLESGADSSNRYRIAFGTITNSGSTPSMSVGTHTTIHATSSGVYNQADGSDIAIYWPDMGAIVTALEYGDDDSDANFVKAFKVNTSDNSVLTGDQDGLMFADTAQERYSLTYDSTINRVVIFSVQSPSSTDTVYGNILDYDSGSTNGLTLELEKSLPGTQCFLGVQGSSAGGSNGAWAAYNPTANIHHVLIKETSDSDDKIRNVKISGSDGSFTIDPHTTYELTIPDDMDTYTTIWWNNARGMLGVAGASTSSSSGVALRGLGYTFTEDTGTEANSTFTANGSAVQFHDSYYGRYLNFDNDTTSDMHTGNFAAILEFYGGSGSNRGIIVGFDTGG